jgi:large conductance mechanosensitive channel
MVQFSEPQLWLSTTPLLGYKSIVPGPGNRPSASQVRRMQMWQEFKEFAFKGNAFDLAVGVIIGAAFGKIVDSIVNDLIMPIIGAIFGGLDFSNYFVGLSSAVNAPTLAAAKDQGAVFAYGNFITVLIYFLIIAFILFQMVKFASRMRREAPPPPPPAPNPTEKLLGEIRDILAAKNK